jgi:c-di-GMP-binding flagellar brake protein YcgR
VRADIRVPMKFHSERTGPFDGMIVNISAGGALIKCPISIETGECVAFQYAFRKRILPFTLKVLYQRDEHDETQEEKKEKTFFYGCRFVHISPGAEADVRGFVFRKQREDIHRSSDEPAE